MNMHRIQVEFGIAEIDRGQPAIKVLLDGTLLNGVTKVQIDSNIGGVTQVTLTMAALVTAAIVAAPGEAK